jgi:hypothetical protein
MSQPSVAPLGIEESRTSDGEKTSGLAQLVYARLRSRRVPPMRAGRLPILGPRASPAGKQWQGAARRIERRSDQHCRIPLQGSNSMGPPMLSLRPLLYWTRPGDSCV